MSDPQSQLSLPKPNNPFASTLTKATASRNPWKPVGVLKANLGVEGPQQINRACNYFSMTAKIRTRWFYFLSFKAWQYSVPGCRNLIGHELSWSTFPTQTPNPEDKAAKQKNGPESSPDQKKWNSSSSESGSRDTRKDMPVTLSRSCRGPP